MGQAVEPVSRVETDGALWAHITPNGRELAIYTMLMGQCRLTVGEPGALLYEDAYCYHSFAEAKEEALEWNGGEGEPQGWYRHPASGRRRPDGDAELEYINL